MNIEELINQCPMAVFSPRYTSYKVGVYLVPFGNMPEIGIIADKLTDGGDGPMHVEEMLDAIDYPIVYGDTLIECMQKLEKKVPHGIYSDANGNDLGIKYDMFPELFKILETNWTYGTIQDFVKRCKEYK
jgi:hypothetical protein